jgi:ATP-dependent Clp protease ATP-binding subunit ClpC
VPKVNVYLPGWLADAVRESPISISAVCQRALTDELAAQPAGEVTPPLTNRAQDVLRRATQAGMASGDLALLAGLDGEGGNLALVILGAVGVDRARLRERVVAAAKRRGGPDVPWLVARAARDATELGDEHVGCEHLLLALVADVHAPAAKLLARLGADPVMVGQAARSAAAAASYTRANSLAGNTAAALGDIRARLSRLERR